MDPYLCFSSVWLTLGRFLVLAFYQGVVFCVFFLFLVVFMPFLFLFCRRAEMYSSMISMYNILATRNERCPLVVTTWMRDGNGRGANAG